MIAWLFNHIVSMFDIYSSGQCVLHNHENYAVFPQH